MTQQKWSKVGRDNIETKCKNCKFKGANSKEKIGKIKKRFVY
jgi:hypothetical protein